MTNSLNLSGPEGTLETIIDTPKTNPSALWIISHPHPSHGGTMHNKVVYTLSRIALAHQAIAVRYNFRGIGNSQGTTTDTFEEKNDLLSVYQYCQTTYPTLPIVLAGFSFGSYICLLCEPHIKPTTLILVAPPAGKQPYQFSTLIPKCKTLVLVGKKDDVIDPFQCLKFATEQTEADAIWLNDCGHFFDGQLVTLKTSISNWLNNQSK